MQNATMLGMSQPDPAATAAAAAAADRRNASSSLRRALSILMFLAEDGGHPVGVTLTELATGLGLSKSTVLRLAAPLREARLVDQDAESGRYRLGPQNALLGQVYLERLDVRRVASPLLQQLAEEVGETVHLLTFDAPEIVYIDKVESPQPVRMHSRIGSRQPAYCTATGKAFLAHATEDVVDLVIAAGMPARTEYTITSPTGCAPTSPSYANAATPSTTSRTSTTSAAPPPRSSTTPASSPPPSPSPAPPPASPTNASPGSAPSSPPPPRPSPSNSGDPSRRWADRPL